MKKRFKTQSIGLKKFKNRTVIQRAKKRSRKDLNPKAYIWKKKNHMVIQHAKKRSKRHLNPKA